jgi:hypothetical protein
MGQIGSGFNDLGAKATGYVLAGFPDLHRVTGNLATPSFM